MRLTRLLWSAVTGHLEPYITQYAQFKPSSLTIQQLVDFGQKGDRKASFLFLRKELLVRFAHSLKELDLIPHALLAMPSVQLMKQWYQQSFHEIYEFADAHCSDQNLKSFLEALKLVLRRNQDVVQALAEGIIQLKETHGVNVVVENTIQYFLDRFYINRISMRMIMNQHIMIFGNEAPVSHQFIGSIDPACDVVSVVEDAYGNAKNLCESYYGKAPKLVFRTKNAVEKSDRITVVYVPSHLYHICFELFKNSMRATIENTNNGTGNGLHDIHAIIVKGKEDLSIKISDQGGGVPRSVTDVLFNYMYTTAPAPPPNKDQTLPPFAGYGYGLPLSRLYARYFKGDLMVTSLEGYGTDACVYLKALAIDASELLPIYSTSCKKIYESSPQVSDWSQPPTGSVQPRRDYRRDYRRF